MTARTRNATLSHPVADADVSSVRRLVERVMSTTFFKERRVSQRVSAAACIFTRAVLVCGYRLSPDDAATFYEEQSSRSIYEPAVVPGVR